MPDEQNKLPRELQTLVDNEDDFYDDIYPSYSVDTTETPYRYLAYANRLRTILLSTHRYVAYSSELGESFRPVAHPSLVRTAYAISWTYVTGDVLHEGYKAYLRNKRAVAPVGTDYKDATSCPVAAAAGASSSGATTEDGMEIVRGMVTGDISLGGTNRSPIPLMEDYRLVMAKRAIFQTLASMALPAFTIHSVVKYSGRMMRGSKSVFFRTWGPVGLGLAVIPALPYLFDEPVEEAVEWVFRTGLKNYVGEHAVQPLRSPQKRLLQEQSGSGSGAESQVVSWEEYKAEKQRAHDERMKEREQKGVKGPLALLGLNGKGKSE